MDKSLTDRIKKLRYSALADFTITPEAFDAILADVRGLESGMRAVIAEVEKWNSGGRPYWNLPMIPEATRTAIVSAILTKTGAIKGESHEPGHG